jgi:oligopeptide transport system substrate-binding protein
MKNIFYILGIITILFSCDGNSLNDSENKNSVKSKLGGEIVVPLDSYFKIQKPTEILKVEGAQISGQMFESLIKYNSKTLIFEPALAEAWEVSEDGLTYKFNIRQGVYFHNNACFPEGKGREMSTQDVVDMFYRVYENLPNNTGYFLFQNTISGGDDYYNGDAEEISGITSTDKTVTVTLPEVSNTFLSKLLTIYGSIIPREAYTTENWSAVGTGPFMYNAKLSNSKLVVLNKNQNYWLFDSSGIQLPYLDKMDDFWASKTVLVKNVPITKISDVLEERIESFEGKDAKYVLESVPQMSTTYLEFNMDSKIMKDVRIRKAISLAIDRKRLVEKTLKNQAFEIGKFCITPPLTKIFTGYDFEGIEDFGYTKNTQLAKKLLAEAGYPDGKGFPTISAQFKMDNSMYLIMTEIQNQLKSTLNINLDIEQVEFNQLLENNAMGTADIFENIWIGDFPSPESFLVNFYGELVPKDKSAPSIVNGGRYINPEFDILFEKGMHATTTEEANQYFAEAEKTLMQNPAMAVLFYGENLWLKQASLKNFHTNGMNYLDFTHVYIEEVQADDSKDLVEESH